MATIIQRAVSARTYNSSAQSNDRSPQTHKSVPKRPSTLISILMGLGVAIAPFLLPTAAQSNQSDNTGVVGGIETHRSVQEAEPGSGGTGDCRQKIISEGTRRFALEPLSYGNLDVECSPITIGPGTSEEGTTSLGSGTGGGDNATEEDTRSVLW